VKKTEPTTPELCITGLGLATSVGHDHITACASIRAGFARPKKLDHFYAEPTVMYEDPDDGYINGHPVLDGDPDHTGDRMVTLLSMALDDLDPQKGSHSSGLSIPRVYLVLPEKERMKNDPHIPDRLRDVCERRFPGTVVEMCFNGHAGMVLALSKAADSIRVGRYDRVLIAGVDSLLGFDDLMRFEQQGRLKTALNSDGLVPGEAAAAVLVESLKSAEKRNAAPPCMILGLSTAREERTVLSGKPSDGTGLVRAIAALSGQLTDKPLAVEAVITDLNGEPYRFNEWGMIQSRIMVKIEGERTLICPARNIGDTGAASAGVALCLAARAIARGYLSPDPGNESALALIDRKSVV
jgi:3-oxoacyl-[acyl-carrier-protein] synthase-1